MLYDVANVALSYLVTRETTQYRLCTLAARPAGIGTMHCCMSTVFAELAARVKGSPGSRLARLAALGPPLFGSHHAGYGKLKTQEGDLEIIGRQRTIRQSLHAVNRSLWFLGFYLVPPAH